MKYLATDILQTGLLEKRYQNRFGNQRKLDPQLVNHVKKYIKALWKLSVVKIISIYIYIFLYLNLYLYILFKFYNLKLKY